MNIIHSQSQWDAIRREYERRSETSFASLARDYGVPVSEISVRAQREEWTKRFDLAPLPDTATQVSHVLAAQTASLLEATREMSGVFGLIPKTDAEVMQRGWEPKDVLGAAKLAFDMQKFTIEQAQRQEELKLKTATAAPNVDVHIGGDVNITPADSYDRVSQALRVLTDPEYTVVDTDFVDGEGTPVDPAEVIAREGSLSIDEDTPEGVFGADDDLSF